MAQSFLTKIATAGAGAVKSFLGADVPSIDILSPMNYGNRTGSLPNSGWMFDSPSAGYDTYFSFTGLDDIVKAYETCPVVYSIINKQAYAITNGKTWLMDNKGKPGKGPYADKISSLLAAPNMFQNWKQFEAQMTIYIRLFGYCMVLPVIPVGYTIEDATALWIVPPYMCTIEYAEGTFFNMKNGFIKSITISYGREKTTITEMDKIIILKDITPGFSDGNIFLPSSPVKPLQQNINNLIGIANSKGTLINYRGALGILTPEIDPNGAIAQTPDEISQMQNDLMRYGVRSGQWKFIVANSAMKWQQMGMSYRELMLTEWGEDDTMVICDGLNYPYKLLSNTASGSMAGTEANEWKKLLYQDFAMPFGKMITEQLGEALGLKEQNLHLEKDFSHVSVLQEDDLKNATARKARNDALLIEFQNNMLTLNRWLELNNEDAMPGDLGKKYYYELVELGWTFGGGGMTLQLTDPKAATTPTTAPKP